jgi:hypothetical protein
MPTTKPYREFIVRVEPLGGGPEEDLSSFRVYFNSKLSGGISRYSLPAAVQKVLTKPGTYRVQRVTQVGIKLALETSTAWAARYSETHAGLCDRLCRLLRYSGKAPETIRVKIRRVKL